MRNYFLMGMVGMMLLCGTVQADLIDNGDGTVSDTETGLMWQKGEAGAMSWNAALTYCETLVFPVGGYDDWRLPNRNELQSLVDYSRYNHVIDKTAFPGAMSSGYWSSTTYANNTEQAWHVYFNYGDVYGSSSKSNSFYVRAVRGGE